MPIIVASSQFNLWSALVSKSQLLLLKRRINRNKNCWNINNISPWFRPHKPSNCLWFERRTDRNSFSGNGQVKEKVYVALVTFRFLREKCVFVIKTASEDWNMYQNSLLTYECALCEFAKTLAPWTKTFLYTFKYHAHSLSPPTLLTSPYYTHKWSYTKSQSTHDHDSWRMENWSCNQTWWNTLWCYCRNNK